MRRANNRYFGGAPHLIDCLRCKLILPVSLRGFVGA
jgi:hypothetical protein